MARKRNRALAPLHHLERSRALYTLSDQSYSPSIPITDFREPRSRADHGWNHHAESFIAANRASLDALDIDPIFAPSEGEISLRLKTSGMIGAVPLDAPDTRQIGGGVVVRPRFGWNGIGPVMQRTGFAARPQMLELPLVPGSAKEVPPWVLAGPLLQRLESLLREIRRGFEVFEEVRETPRGQILWNRYATHTARGELHRFPCRYSDLGLDLRLRSFIRWGVTRVRDTLVPYAAGDAIARVLSEQSQKLLEELREVPAAVPSHRQLDEFLRMTLGSNVLRQGLQALGWIVDERGLAGASASDGLSWSLPMHELFEHWVERLVRDWARERGADVKTGREMQTVVPIEWESAAQASMKTLVPDFVVRHGDEVIVIDAKYKGHFQDFDEAQWMEMADEVRSEHRHDLHQILAYAALFETPSITAMLVYPMHATTWTRLATAGRTTTRATIHAFGRQLQLRIVGVPLEIRGELSGVERFLYGFVE
jgi:hypothetical protein